MRWRDHVGCLKDPGMKSAIRNRDNDIHCMESFSQLPLDKMWTLHEEVHLGDSVAHGD
jgi:hypothetical protein